MRCNRSARVWPTRRPARWPSQHSHGRNRPAKRPPRTCSTPISSERFVLRIGQQPQRQAATPDLLYADLLAATHRTLARTWGREPEDAESIRFGQSVGDWPAFADAAESLAYLQRHHRLITLTNCDRASYRGSAARLGDPWDAILTAEEIGSYKPSLANFEFLLARVAADFGHAPGSILHVAQSLFHDHVPAKALGLTTAWIDRRAGRKGGATVPPQKAVVFQEHGGAGRPAPSRTGLNPPRRRVDESEMRR